LSPPPRNPSPGRLAGIDFGTVRIGVAVTDPDQRFVNPLDTYTRRTLELDADYFQKLVTDEQITKFIVGLPIHLHGGESKKSTEAREFARWLTAVTNVAVEFFDERFTTSEARDLLRQADLAPHRRKNKRKLDKLAAHILLTAYLEARARGDDSLAPLDDPPG